MIHAAIVGLGRWGQNLVDAVQSSSDQIHFVAGMVRHPEAVRDYAQQQDFRLYDNYDDLLADPNIQAVVLATPHQLHVPQILAAAKAGKAVFCEKPLALTLADVQMATQACTAAGVVLAVGQDKRFWASMMELQKQVASGRLGQLMHIEGNLSNEHSAGSYRAWRMQPENSPGASLTATGIHILDAFVHLLGPVKKIHANSVVHPGLENGVMDSLSMSFVFENGATGHLASVRPSPFFWRVHVFGTEGSAEARGPNVVELLTTGGKTEVIHCEPNQALRYELEAFAKAINGVAPYPISIDQMLLTGRTLEAAIQAVDQQREVLL